MLGGMIFYEKKGQPGQYCPSRNGCHHPVRMRAGVFCQSGEKGVDNAEKAYGCCWQDEKNQGCT